MFLLRALLAVRRGYGKIWQSRQRLDKRSEPVSALDTCRCPYFSATVLHGNRQRMDLECSVLPARISEQQCCTKVVIACREEFGGCRCSQSSTLAVFKATVLDEIAPISQFLGSYRLVFARHHMDARWVIMMDFRQLRPSSFTGYHRSHGLSNSRDLLVSDGHGDGPRVSAQTAPVGSPRCCPDNCT